MGRGAFASDLKTMFSDMGETIEIDGVVLTDGAGDPVRAHFQTDVDPVLTGGGNRINSTSAAIEVPSGLLPSKVRQGKCTIVLIGHDDVRREYQVENCIPLGDGATEMLSLTGGKRCA